MKEKERKEKLNICYSHSLKDKELIKNEWETEGERDRQTDRQTYWVCVYVVGNK